ncbi:MAG: hypothetical protein ACWGO2_04750 [Syntrophobacteria bacterium]
MFKRFLTRLLAIAQHKWIAGLTSFDTKTKRFTGEKKLREHDLICSGKNIACAQA